MHRGRVPLVLSAAIVLAQIFRVPPLVDVVAGRAPSDVHLAWPFGHILLAPLTLTADWLNGGSRADFIGFGVWVLIGFAVSRFVLGGRPRRLLRELAWLTGLLVAVGSFVAWGALASRPIPRLVAEDSSLIVFDVHSHTSLSHDGRRGFGVAANAAWHARAGFDAAWITDHNRVGAARQWQVDRAGRPPRLLGGEELSLSGLHMVALGVDSLIDNRPADRSFEASLAFLAQLESETAPERRPYLIASLPEYWRHHWGRELGSVVLAGVEGFEIWTTSPQAMEFPPSARRVVLGWSRLERRAWFGATDMHGLGYAASVWNVARLPGWRALDDAALSRALIASFRERGPDATRVVAMRRWQPGSPPAQLVSVPVNAVVVLRSASRAHAAALLAWIWAAAGLVSRRRAARTP